MASKDDNKQGETTRVVTNKGRVVVESKDGRLVVENNYGQVAGTWHGGMRQSR